MTSEHAVFDVFTFDLTPRGVDFLQREAKDDFHIIKEACAQWMEKTESHPRGQRPICVDCDLEFSPLALPAGFTVAIPFNRNGPMVVCGICVDCLTKKDINERITSQFRTLWPDLRVALVKGGRA
jgi:hypothetical protein